MSVIGKDLKKNTAYTIKVDQKCFSIKQEAGQGSVNYREQHKKRKDTKRLVQEKAN